MSIMAKTPSGYKKIGSAYIGERPVDKVFNANGDVVYALQRELTGVPTLLFKGKEQSELLNYRIYGDTVDGESVGDRTANLFYKKIENANISSAGGIHGDNFDLWIGKVTAGETYTAYNTNMVVGFFTDEPDYGAYTYDHSRITNATMVYTFTVPSGCSYVAIRSSKNANLAMLAEGSTALPYEPYGYKMPVTVEGKNLFSSRIEQGSFNSNTGVPNDLTNRVRSHVNDYIYLIPGIYKISVSGAESFVICAYNTPDINTFNANLSNISWVDLPSTISIYQSAYYKFGFRKNDNSVVTTSDISNIMLNVGSTALPYEPYHAPVTTPIYLPEPIKMVGDEAEYVDYAEQKQHRVRKNLFDGEWVQGGIDNSGNFNTYSTRVYTTINVNGGATYTLQANQLIRMIYAYYYNGTKYTKVQILLDITEGVTTATITIPSNANVIGVSLRNDDNTNMEPIDVEWCMLNSGSTPLPYEPYIENTELDVTLPALPTIKGTNTMRVDTEVQPSRMDIKGRIKNLI